jgi:hypothetical protein
MVVVGLLAGRRVGAAAAAWKVKTNYVCLNNTQNLLNNNKPGLRSFTFRNRKLRKMRGPKIRHVRPAPPGWFGSHTNNLLLLLLQDSI